MSSDIVLGSPKENASFGDRCASGEPGSILEDPVKVSQFCDGLSRTVFKENRKRQRLSSSGNMDWSFGVSDGDNSSDDSADELDAWSDSEGSDSSNFVVNQSRHTVQSDRSQEVKSASKLLAKFFSGICGSARLGPKRLAESLLNAVSEVRKISDTLPFHKVLERACSTVPFENKGAAKQLKSLTMRLWEGHPVERVEFCSLTPKLRSETHEESRERNVERMERLNQSLSIKPFCAGDIRSFDNFLSQLRSIKNSEWQLDIPEDIWANWLAKQFDSGFRDLLI